MRKLIVKLFQCTGESNYLYITKRSKVITDQGLMWFYSKIQHLNRVNRIKSWLVEEEHYRTQLEIQYAATIKSEDHVSLVVIISVPKALASSETDTAATKDSALQGVISAVRSGCWCKVPIYFEDRRCFKARSLKPFFLRIFLIFVFLAIPLELQIALAKT